MMTQTTRRTPMADTVRLPKRMWRAQRLERAPIVTENGVHIAVTLPEGCVGVMLVFRTKRAARAWYGKDVPLVDVGWEDPLKR